MAASPFCTLFLTPFSQRCRRGNKWLVELPDGRWRRCGLFRGSFIVGVVEACAGRGFVRHSLKGAALCDLECAALVLFHYQQAERLGENPA